MLILTDEVFISGSELSHAEFRLYIGYCFYRNKMTGLSFPHRKTISEATGINISYISSLKGELLKKGWIEIEGDAVRPLKGFAKVGKTAAEDSEQELDYPTTQPATSLDGSTGVLDSPTQELDGSTGVLDSPTAIKEEPKLEPRLEPKPLTDDVGKNVKPAARRNVKTDEEFLSELELDPAYEGLDVRLCYQKMLRWCQINNKQPTRRRFINWLNREDRPMNVAVNGASNETNSRNPNRNPASRPSASERNAQLRLETELLIRRRG